jgi:type VII secretion protein EccE
MTRGVRTPHPVLPRATARCYSRVRVRRDILNTCASFGAVSLDSLRSEFVSGIRWRHLLRRAHVTERLIDMRRTGSAQRPDPMIQQMKNAKEKVVAPQPSAQPILSNASAIMPARVMPVADLMGVQSLAAIGLGVAILLHQPGWHGSVAGLGIALLLAVRLRGLSIPRWATGRAGFWRDRHRRRKKAKPTDPFDAEQPDGSRIGLCWDGETLMSLIRLEGDPGTMTVLKPAMAVSGEVVSVQLMADFLRQFDIALESIDVISQGSRSKGHGDLAAVYDTVLGPLPAIAKRTVWVAIRVNPTLCPDALRERGGDWEGLLRTTATATRRVAGRLSEAGIRSRIMTAPEIGQATGELLDGAALTAIDESWHSCHEGRFALRSFLITPSMFTTSGLGLLWTVPSLSTTMCVSLRRDTRNQRIQLRGIVRFNGRGRARMVHEGLGQLPGRQYDALVASLPMPAPRRSVAQWLSVEGDGAIDDLALPAAGCGQVVGADENGRAVAIPLFGPDVARVEICSTLHLAQQVVLRSLALGARVHVNTARATAWRPMVEQVGDREVLSVTDLQRGTANANVDVSCSVVVFDGAAEDSVQMGVTTMVIKPSHARPSSDADATLQLLDPDENVVRVGTRTGSMLVTMVTTDDEMRYIQSSLDIVD